MIRSFKDREAAGLFAGRFSRRLPPDVQRRAHRKLLMLDAAAGLEFLAAAPGNRLEALRGDRRGQWSIRINDQWRLCFRWRDGAAEDVEIVDYHRG
ncbi:MAG: type II toxin-antitoxin system RelE/ParE family toxin [Rhodospirillales bacterium]